MGLGRSKTSRGAVVLVAGALLLLPGPAGAQRRKLTEDQVLARFAAEPSVQQVQQAAIKYYQVHPDRIRDLRRNAQLKALMPTISGRFENGVATEKRRMDDGIYYQAMRQNPQLMPFGKENETVNADNLGWSVSATWDLDRLVFNAEVLDVQSLIGIMDGVVREVTTVYYIRRRLQINILLNPPTTLADKISQRIRVEELTGLLDAMTGGFMTRAIAKANKASAPRVRTRRPTTPPKPAPASASDQ